MKSKILMFGLLAVMAAMPACLHAQNQPTAICENNSFQCSQSGNQGSIFANTWVSLYGTSMPTPTSVVFIYQIGSGCCTNASNSVTPIYTSTSQVNVCLTIPSVQDNTLAYAELQVPTGGGGQMYLIPPVPFFARTTNPGYAACS